MRTKNVAVKLTLLMVVGCGGSKKNDVPKCDPGQSAEAIFLHQKLGGIPLASQSFPPRHDGASGTERC